METHYLAVPWKHLENSGGPREMLSCLITLIAICSANIFMYEHSTSPLQLMVNKIRPFQSAGFMDNYRWGMSWGQWVLTADQWWAAALTAFASVLPAALLLIISLYSASTHFSQESSICGIFVSLLQRRDGFLCFSFPWTYPSLRDLQLSPVPASAYPFSPLPFWWWVLFVWVLLRVFFNYVFIAF